jgi:hypothetical protein
MYECFECGLEFNYIHHFQSHIASKNGCRIQKNKKIDCSICGKNFTSEKTLNNHMKTKCKKEIDGNETHDKIKNLEEQLKQLQTILTTQKSSTITNTDSNITNCNNSTANINSNNTTNMANTANITSNQTINHNKLTIVNFGKEDIDKLSDDDKKEILNSCYGAILRCAKKVNFNPEFPEQRNIFLTNPKSAFAYKYETNKYQAIETNDLLDQIIHHRASDVRDLVEQNDVLKISESKIKRVNKLLDNIDNEKPDDIAYIKKDLRLILFNENEPALDNKKKYDEIKDIKKQKLLKNK